MSYQRKYYSHGMKPFAYNWTGSAQRPSMTHNQGLGDDAAPVVATIVEDTSAQHPTDTTAPAQPRVTEVDHGPPFLAYLAVGVLGLWYFGKKRK